MFTIKDDPDHPINTHTELPRIACLLLFTSI
jgi:hypothetical protein